MEKKQDRCKAGGQGLGDGPWTSCSCNGGTGSGGGGEEDRQNYKYDMVLLNGVGGEWDSHGGYRTLEMP